MRSSQIMCSRTISSDSIFSQASREQLSERPVKLISEQKSQTISGEIRSPLNGSISSHGSAEKRFRKLLILDRWYIVLVISSTTWRSNQRRGSISLKSQQQRTSSRSCCIQVTTSEGYSSESCLGMSSMKLICSWLVGFQSLEIQFFYTTKQK